MPGVCNEERWDLLIAGDLAARLRYQSLVQVSEGALAESGQPKTGCRRGRKIGGGMIGNGGGATNATRMRPIASVGNVD